MKRNNIIIFFSTLLLIGCGTTYTPHPYGYVRIEIPEPVYETFDSAGFPYSFNINRISTIENKNGQNEKYWLDIHYNNYNARIHCSYKPVENNLGLLSEEAEKFVYKHANMASSIPCRSYENQEKKVYAVVYDIEGNTASPCQFVITDSTNHFFRGALYFNCTPNQDSLSPIIDYIKEDIVELMESFSWK